MSDNRTLAQFFFEHGFFDCYAEALARNDAKPFAVPDDRGMELLWKRHPNGIDSEELADFHSKAALANAADDLLASLLHLRAFWKPGSNHDTQEVQLALAAADAAIAKALGRTPNEIGEEG